MVTGVSQPVPRQRINARASWTQSSLLARGPGSFEDGSREEAEVHGEHQEQLQSEIPHRAQGRDVAESPDHGEEEVDGEHAEQPCAAQASHDG